MSALRIKADTGSLRSFADRSSDLTMVARSQTAYLDEALWGLKNSSSEFVGHIPSLDTELRAVLSGIEVADNEVRSVAVRFEATQQLFLPAIQRWVGPDAKGLISTIRPVRSGGHPFAMIPPSSRSHRRTSFAGLRSAEKSRFGRHVLDPSTVVVATGTEEVDVSLAAVVGVEAAAGYEWTEYADGHIEVTETIQGGGSIEKAWGADISAWEGQGGAGFSVGVADAEIRQETFEVADHDELHTLVKHRLLRRAEDAHESVHGLISSAPGAEWIGGVVVGAVPVNIRSSVGQLVDSAVEKIAPDLDEIAAYEPTRTGGSSGVQVQVRVGASGGLTLVKDAAGVAVDGQVNVTFAEMHSDEGIETRRVTIQAAGEGTLGVLGVRVGGTPTGVQGLLGGSVKVVSTADAAGRPTAVEIEAEVQNGDDVTVETISYDLSDPAQRAEVAPISALAAGDASELPASVRLIAGVVGGRVTTGHVGSKGYDVTRQKSSLGAKVAAGGKLEAKVSHKSERRERTD